MNLHQIASGAITRVNPFEPVAIRFSTGFAINSDMSRTPQYGTSGAFFTGALAAGVLTVSAIGLGVLSDGQVLLGRNVGIGTVVIEQSTGPAGGIGTYAVTGSQVLASQAMAASTVFAQVQELTTEDIGHLDALNIQGSTRKMYVDGHVDAVVRFAEKGGDLVTRFDGTIWLTANVLERWPDWCAVALTLQDGS